MMLFHEVFGREWCSWRIHLRFTCKWMFDCFWMWTSSSWMVFVIWTSFCMCLSTTTTSMSPNKLHVLFLEAAACFWDEFWCFRSFCNKCTWIGNGCETLVDEFKRLEFIFSSASLLASCRCLLQEGTARQEEAQHSMLHENELHVIFFRFPVWKRDPSACSEAVGCFGVLARYTPDAVEADPSETTRARSSGCN